MNSEKFIDLLKNQCQLSLEVPVVAGISGGPDSLCMLDLLIKSRVNVTVVHINHQLRSQADEEARLVSDFCVQNDVNCIIGKFDVSNYATEEKFSIEESARILRYQFLFEQAKKFTAQAVMVAHNADDQAETVLMHLLRGCGLSGLKGMQMCSIQPQWSESIPLIRPLLKIGREEIIDYCRTNQLLPAFDLTNEDTKYFRNRIRQELLPELKTYNQGIKDHLVNMAEVIAFEDEFISFETEKAWDECLIRRGDQLILFSRQRLRSLHPAILRRVLRVSINAINPTLRDIDFNVIDRAIRFLMTDGQVNHLLLIADVEIIKDRHEQVIICDQENPLIDLWPQIMINSNQKVNIDGVTDLGGGWQIVCKRDTQPTGFNRDAMKCTLDVGKIEGLHIDTFQPGDRFNPFNLKGKIIKLSDLWTNYGLPERARSHWPLLKNQIDEIVWVPGFQISDEHKVTTKTSEFLHLSLINKNMKA